MDDSERAVTEVVGDHLAVLRRAAGLSQADLAAAMAALGFQWDSRQTVAEVEAGRRQVTLEELVALAAFFDMPINWLLSGPWPYSRPQVRIGNQVVDSETWVNLVEPRYPEGLDDIEIEPQDRMPPPSGPVRKAIDVLVGKLDRPWSRLWRKRGELPAEPFAQAWEEKMASRTRLPGPIYLLTGDEPVQTSVATGPWGTSVGLALEPGVPHVARSEEEAQQLEALERQGFVRRIPRHVAYRLRKRQKGAGQDGPR